MIKLEDLPNPLPRQWEMDAYLVLVNYEHIGPRITIDTSPPLKNSHDDKLLSKAKITFEVGEIDIPGIQIESLKNKKQQILAEAHVKAEQIEQQIQSLLAIEYQPETDGAA